MIRGCVVMLKSTRTGGSGIAGGRRDDRNSAQRHVWGADPPGLPQRLRGTAETVRRAGVSKPDVWGWQRRFCLPRSMSSMAR
jgi:hypothetical protein